MPTRHPTSDWCGSANRRLPWFASGPTYAAWALGWYSHLVDGTSMMGDGGGGGD